MKKGREEKEKDRHAEIINIRNYITIDIADTKIIKGYENSFMSIHLKT